MTKQNTIVLIMLIAIGIFLMIDHIFTWVGVNGYGVIVEANPIMKPLINNVNIFVSIAIKLLYYFLLAMLIFKLNNKKPNNKTPYLLGLVLLVYVSVVIYHCVTWVKIVLAV